MNNTMNTEDKTALEQAIMNEINNETEDYTEEDKQAFIENIKRYGTNNGDLGILIYDTDVLAFYEKYKEDIQKLFLNNQITTDTLTDFLAGWDIYDPLVLENNNKILAVHCAFQIIINNLY